MPLSDMIKRFGGVTESYWFYTNSDNPIELRYDPKDHVYLLVGPEGLEKLDGVTSVVHIIDKSNALVPWACKMMYQKALRTLPEPTDGIYVQTFAELDAWLHKSKDGHQDKLEEAGDIGHVAHAWIEDYIKLLLAHEGTTYLIRNKEIDDHFKKLETLNEKSANCCLAAIDWMKKHKVKWISTERKIYSRKYKYAGTMDGLCRCTSCDDPLCCPEPFIDRLTVADWKTSNYLYLEYLFQTAAYEQAYEEETGEEVLDRWVIRLGKEDGEFEPWHLEEHNFGDDFDGFVDALRLTRRVRLIEERIRAKKADVRAAIKAERDAARAIKEAAEVEERRIAKETKARERLEALAVACAASKTYKGRRKSSCDNGKDGGNCEACARIYAEAQAGKPQPKPKKEVTPCVPTTNSDVKSTLEPKKLNSLLAVLVPRTKPATPLPAATQPFRPFALLPATTERAGSTSPMASTEQFPWDEYLPPFDQYLLRPEEITDLT